VLQRTSAPDARRALEAPHQSDPFRTRLQVPVAGGPLTVTLAGAPPDAGRPVVLAIHGMTGTHMVYRTIARELSRQAPEACLIVPDLRGRGRSAVLPEPYGIATHIADLLAVLDHVGAERAVVVGHSMGCNIGARFAADHPERTAAVVLLDGGLPIVAEHEIADADEDGDEPHGLFDRFELQCATVDEYVGYWRRHPALERAWDADIEAFVGCDFVTGEHGVRCIAKMEAALIDVQDLMFDGRTWHAISRAQVPVRLMRAERGMYDDDPLLPLPEIGEFLRDNPHVSVELIPDVNHFTMVIGGGHGPRRVAETLAEFSRETPVQNGSEVPHG
jgi:lipase